MLYGQCQMLFNVQPFHTFSNLNITSAERIDGMNVHIFIMNVDFPVSFNNHLFNLPIQLQQMFSISSKHQPTLGFHKTQSIIYQQQSIVGHNSYLYASSRILMAVRNRHVHRYSIGRTFPYSCYRSAFINFYTNARRCWYWF